MADPMLSRLTSKLTFANVCSCLALVVALGTGGAYAAGTIGSHEIKNKSIRSVDIKDGQVRAPDLGGDAVDGTKVSADSLTAQDLAAGSVGNSELADDTVTGVKTAANSIGLADLVGSETQGHINLDSLATGRCAQANFTVAGAEVGQAALVTTDDDIQNGVVFLAQRVSTAGHVEVDVCNLSGVALTPVSNFPVRLFTVG